MLFICVDDFYRKADSVTRLTREEEKLYAAKGTIDPKLAESYYPMIAACMRRYPKDIQTLYMVYLCLHELEKAIETFDFHHSREPFSHHLHRRLRQCLVKCIVRNH